MSYREFPGIFKWERYLPEHSVWSAWGSVHLGWEEDFRTLWLIPWNSSRRANHPTGSSRSRPLDLQYVVDLWRKPPKPVSIKNVLEIQFTKSLYHTNSLTRFRITEKRGQGRLDEVLAVLRAAWTPFDPLPIPEEDSEEWDDLVYGSDDDDSDDDSTDERAPRWV